MIFNHNTYILRIICSAVDVERKEQSIVYMLLFYYFNMTAEYQTKSQFADGVHSVIVLIPLLKWFYDN